MKKVKPQSFGTRLRTLREQKDMSVADLALAAKVSRQHIHDLQFGRTEPSLDMAQRLARALRVGLGELAEGK
jgi:transcriptional regulator with XRE-family HTH domain